MSVGRLMSGGWCRWWDGRGGGVGRAVSGGWCQEGGVGRVMSGGWCQEGGVGRMLSGGYTTLLTSISQHQNETKLLVAL